MTKNIPILFSDVVLPASARFTAWGKAKSNSPCARSPDAMAMEQYRRINKYSLHSFYSNILISGRKDSLNRQPLIIPAAQADVE